MEKVGNKWHKTAGKNAINWLWASVSEIGGGGRYSFRQRGQEEHEGGDKPTVWRDLNKSLGYGIVVHPIIEHGFSAGNSRGEKIKDGIWRVPKQSNREFAAEVCLRSVIRVAC